MCKLGKRAYSRNMGKLCEGHFNGNDVQTGDKATKYRFTILIRVVIASNCAPHSPSAMNSTQSQRMLHSLSVLLTQKILAMHSTY